MTRPLIALVLLALLGYGGWEAYPLLAGPALSIESPEEGGSYPGGVVAIAGRVRRAASFTLDGAPLLTDAVGRFRTTLAFPPGGSILTFTATDWFGRTITATQSIYASAVEPREPTTNH